MITSRQFFHMFHGSSEAHALEPGLWPWGSAGGRSFKVTETPYFVGVSRLQFGMDVSRDCGLSSVPQQVYTVDMEITAKISPKRRMEWQSLSFAASQNVYNSFPHRGSYEYEKKAGNHRSVVMKNNINGGNGGRPAREPSIKTPFFNVILKNEEILQWRGSTLNALRRLVFVSPLLVEQSQRGREKDDTPFSISSLPMGACRWGWNIALESGFQWSINCGGEIACTFLFPTSFSPEKKRRGDDESTDKAYMKLIPDQWSISFLSGEFPYLVLPTKNA